MPGWNDDRNLVRFSLRRTQTQQPAPDGATDLPTPDDSRRRRRIPIVLATTGALVLAGAGVAFAQAHKTVTLDVDGQREQVSTFAGTVSGLLGDQAVTIGTHDALTPTASTALSDGATIVVRHAHRVQVSVDGATSTVWSTALSAADALGALQARGSDVALVPARSTTGRVALPLRLAAAGTVDVLADGSTSTVSATGDVASALAAAKVSVGPRDRVLVHTVDGRLTVQVQRVVVEDKTETSPVDFSTTTRKTSALYTGQKRTVRKGEPGVRTVVYRVTTVDGKETERTKVSDEVTQAPVDAVVEVGTKARPARPAPVVSSPVGGDVWAALAQCESGGNPRAVSSNGLYYGLYQFTVGTWQAMGGSGLPSQASPAEQTARAKALQARSGWGQWPACSLKLGLR
ncbi:G5 domain-containing protein [Isoptericola sp. b441]|uniref:G5 domain-containing protein n=1 Tax=Actinotalea lenta TaxID=3064654 RepID=A0ABT9D7G8_9CELL|nr:MULTISPECIES: resuscitation-promoting factor [unclassified Isoptericola]MDO8106786.1 G5 domain-containing protein [Isoptericola sp. b441]MDO8121503.1 G5 domain-containing protein [Isoptericola sp. b490]